MCSLPDPSVDTLEHSKLVELAGKYMSNTKLQRERAYKYYIRVKDTPEYKARARSIKASHYQNNNDRIRQQEKDKYNDNDGFRERMKELSRLKYKAKTENVVKLKRGRKPKNLEE